MPFGVRFHYDHTFISDPVQLELLQLMQIGEICLEADFFVKEHSQCCCEISYIVSGKGQFFLNDEICEVSAGDIIITPPWGSHKILASSTHPLTYAYIGFSFTDPSGRIRKDTSSFFEDSGQMILKDTLDLYDHFRKCMDEFYYSDSPNHLLIEAFLLQIILLTHRMAKATHPPSLQLPQQKNPGQLVYKIIKYIDRNLSKPLSVGAIAESLGYSPYYISHTFKSKMNKNLQNYICEAKCERAKELILQERLSITEISEKLGFLTIQSFCRTFKRVCGLSPGEFKVQSCKIPKL